MNKQKELRRAVDNVLKAFNPIVTEILKRFESMLNSNDEEDSEVVPLKVVITKKTISGLHEITISLHCSENTGCILHKTTDMTNVN